LLGHPGRFGWRILLMIDLEPVSKYTYWRNSLIPRVFRNVRKIVILMVLLTIMISVLATVFPGKTVICSGVFSGQLDSDGDACCRWYWFMFREHNPVLTVDAKRAVLPPRPTSPFSGLYLTRHQRLTQQCEYTCFN